MATVRREKNVARGWLILLHCTNSHPLILPASFFIIFLPFYPIDGGGLFLVLSVLLSNREKNKPPQTQTGRERGREKHRQKHSLSLSQTHALFFSYNLWNNQNFCSLPIDFFRLVCTRTRFCWQTFIVTCWGNKNEEASEQEKDTKKREEKSENI